ncbi:hypothetical protein D3C84_97880 [compost metagenome]
MESTGELLFGYLQQLLGFLELGDIADHHHQRGGVIQVDGLGGNQAGEGLAAGAAEGHFQVVQRVALLQALEERRADAGDAPDVEVGGGLAEGVAGLDADLLLEGVVDRQQAAVGVTGDDDDVRAVVEHQGELLLGKAQGLFGLLGLGDVDHQAAHHLGFPVGNEGDDVAHPEHPAVCGDHPIVEAVVAAGLGFHLAEGIGPGGVVRVQGAAPEAGLQPGGQGITEQPFGMGRNVGVAVAFHAHFPGDGVEAFHQATVVLFAAAQLFLECGAAGHFAAEAAVDAQHEEEHGGQQDQTGNTVEQGAAPGDALVQGSAHPALLDGGGFFGGDFGEDLVEDARKNRFAARCRHGQLIAIGRFAADGDAVEFELALAPDAGGEVADEGVHLAGGQRMQGAGNAGVGLQIEVGVAAA